MEVGRLLCDSFLCRLCASENKNGTNLFVSEENEQDLSQLVNKYLPLKVEKDGKLPYLICPGCNIQLEATKQFLDLIIEGQNKLRQLFRTQQETIKREEKQRQQLETALKSVNANTSVKTYAIHSDETGEKFFIQVLSDGPLFPPEHELSLQAEGLERPRRKRGRPPKPPPSSEEDSKSHTVIEPVKNDVEQEEEAEVDAEGRKKRKIKVPSRFQEAVQGKELDRIFKEEGVFDDDSPSDEEGKTGDSETKIADEIIGRLESKEGEDLGELVIVNKSTNRVRIKTKDEGSSKKKYECDICGKEFTHLGRCEVHKSFHNNVKYSCDDCKFPTNNKMDMERHHTKMGHVGISIVEDLSNYGHVEVPHQNAEENSEDVDSEIAASCETETEQTDLKSDVKFGCKLCNKTFSCKQNFEVHCKAIHENVRQFQCDKCDKSFSYPNSLKCHLLQHSDKNDKIYPCDICKKIFNHPSSLVYHREAEHNNGRRFVCNKCNKSFKHKQLLQRHQLVHSNDRPHNCDSCSASFKTRANLLNHMPIHTGEKKYFCTQCGQAFAHKTSLTLHVRWHSGQKPYECDVCLKTFSQKGNLAEHRRIHTGEKPYCCNHCGRKFTTSSQFKLHVKRHTGERPWRCEYCSKTFLHKDTWKCHTRRHRNERPYQCQQCFRGFTEQWALKKHERLHTGEKPYVCNICNKGFADCSNLTKHKKIHWNDNKVRIKESKPKIKFIASAGESTDQVVYVTYQDSNSNDGQPQTLVHIMDALDSMNSNDSDPNVLDSDNSLLNSSTSLTNSLNSLHFQPLLDQDGNPVNIATSDGQFIKVITSVGEGQQIIQGILPDGSLIPLNWTIQDGKPVITTEAGIPTDDEDADMDTEYDEKQKTNDENSLNGSASGQLLENNIQFLHDEGQKLDNNVQFLTDEDGQNICLIAAYSMDESITPPFLAIP